VFVYVPILSLSMSLKRLAWHESSVGGGKCTVDKNVKEEKAGYGLLVMEHIQ
jgi:hypothetical protein